MKNINTNKIIFGTANLASNYGLNKTKITDKENLKYLFSFLKKKKIKYIDTAYKYKNNENILKKINQNKFKIIVKFFANNNNSSKTQIYKKIKKTLKNLKIKNLYCLMLHNQNLSLIKTLQIFKIFECLKKDKLIKKSGISIYKKEQLSKIYKIYKPNVIQAPLNILDQDFLKSGWLKRIKKNNTEFHARSIFLQGLLLRKKNNLPYFFKKKKYDKVLNKYYLFLKNKNISNLEACLTFINKIRLVDKIVIGIDSLKNLEDILNTKLLSNISIKSFYNLNDKKKQITDPRKWPKI